MKRRERILQVALELFANDGYNATSTSKIAEQAEVSEGLIFRHFGSKNGLLEALGALADEKISVMIEPILDQQKAKQVIEMALNLPFEVDQSQYDFWRLQFKLKWEPSYEKPAILERLLEKFIWAFEELNAPTPKLEAELLYQLIDTVAIGLLRNEIPNVEGYRTFLLHKYLN